MVPIEDNEKNTMEIGAEPDSEEDFEFVCKKPQWVPEGYTLENEVHEEEWGIYEQCYTNDKEQGMLYRQMNNDAVNNLGISSNGSEQQEVMIENLKDILFRMIHWMKEEGISFGKMESISI